MEPRTFLDALHHAAGDYLLATVLEGEAPGAQLLLRGGVPLWPEHPAPCLSGRLPALRGPAAPPRPHGRWNGPSAARCCSRDIRGTCPHHRNGRFHTE